MCIRDRLGHDPILICNIDAIWLENKPALKSLMAEWDPSLMDDLLLLAPRDETLGYHGAGDFNTDSVQKLTRRDGDSAEYVYAGVQIARLNTVKQFPMEKFSRNKVWDISLKKERIYGHVLNGFWIHVGDPAAREAAEAKLKE